MSEEESRYEIDRLLSHRRLEEAADLLQRLCDENASDIDARLMLAAVQGEMGKITAALGNAAQVLCLDPECVEAYLIESRLLCSMGRIAEGMDKARAAVDIDRDFEDAWILMQMVAQQTEDNASLLLACQNLVRIDPNNEEAWWRLAEVHIQGEELGEAAACLEKLLELNGGHGQAMTLLSALYGQLGNYDAAEHWSRRALVVDTNNCDALINLARTLKEKADYGNSVRSYNQAIKVDAMRHDAWAGLGDIHGILLELNEAESCFRKAMEIEPAAFEYQWALTSILRLKGDFSEAARICKNALKGAPEASRGYVELGNILLAQGNVPESIASYQRARSLDPTDLAAVAGEANAYERLKNYTQALSLLNPYLLQDKNVDSQLALSYSNLARHFNHHEQALRIIEDILRARTITAFERIELNFRAGQLCDDLGQYDAAFRHIELANDEKSVKFDPAAHRAFITSLINRFDKATLARLPRATVKSERPVFIVGMPRSGTSLVEQILASHPDVYGAGELSDIGMMIANFSAACQASYPEWISQLDQDTLNYYADNYLSVLGGLSGSALLVTDKMPQNFLYLGMIQLLFPDAHVIHCQRNPVDTCLSCLFRNFIGDLPFAYSQENLSLYYREYERLMRHWHSVLDIKILDVQYEDLVSGLQEQTQRMLDYLGLDWNERCLRFHETDRVVRTASYDQVRQPLYTGSVGKWKHYRRHLGQLVTEFL